MSSNCTRLTDYTSAHPGARSGQLAVVHEPIARERFTVDLRMERMRGELRPIRASRVGSRRIGEPLELLQRNDGDGDSQAP
jgi:hypothetical protein